MPYVHTRIGTRVHKRIAVACVCIVCPYRMLLILMLGDIRWDRARRIEQHGVSIYSRRILFYCGVCFLFIGLHVLKLVDETKWLSSMRNFGSREKVDMEMIGIYRGISYRRYDGTTKSRA